MPVPTTNPDQEYAQDEIVSEPNGAERYTAHRFLDEAGDTTFFGQGKKLIIGREGVSLAFTIGMVKIIRPLPEVRAEVVALQRSVEQDEYLNVIPSVRKRIERGGFFFHACDDTPEVRQLLFRYIKNLDDFLGDRIRLVVDLFDQDGYEGSRNYYRGNRRLTTENRLSPPSS